jgi:hypothetical protein
MYTGNGSMKIPITVLEFAMYSIELEIKFKKINKIPIRPTYPIVFIALAVAAKP